MRLPERIFVDLAALVSYPGPGHDEALVRSLLYFSKSGNSEMYPDTYRLLHQFASEIGGMSRNELEELYTRTFDINPVATLEIGWHLFGEQYERGSFLVLMREQLRKYGVEETTELPDHFAHVLRLFGRLDDADRVAMLEKYVLRGLDIMLEKWDGESPYRHLIDAIYAMFNTVRSLEKGVPTDV